MKKAIIVTLSIFVFIGLLTWIFVYDYNNRGIKHSMESDIPGVDIELNNLNYYDGMGLMKANHDDYIGKIICYEGFVNNNGDVCFVARAIRDQQKKHDIVYGMECRFKDGAKFEDETWLRIYGVLDEDTEDLTGKTYLYVIVAKGDYEVIEPGQRVVQEIN